MAKDTDALNYPYIRVRDVEWLKRTLLIFPHVARIRPTYGAPADDEAVAAFRRIEGRRGPLLRDVRLDSPAIWQGHHDLRNRIDKAMRRNGARILAKLGKEATLKAWEGDQQDHGLWGRRMARQTFQLHSDKVMHLLLSSLLRCGLAWEPSKADGAGYVELHPHVGEAILSTLAFACAANEGLELVTEFPSVFGRSIHRRREDLLNSFLDLGDEYSVRPVREGRVRRSLPEFVVYQRCDTSKLTPDRLAALNHEWEAVAEFRDALDKLAASVPETIDDPDVLAERLHEQADKMFRQWERNKANLSSFARELFGEGVLEQPQKAIEKIADKALGEEAAGTVIGGLAGQSLIAAGGGLALGIIFRAAKTAMRVRRSSRESPLRYLTMMQDEGVGFVLSA